MQNLIQQLKDNEKPFGLMGEEMQVKAAAMGLLDNFQLFVGPGWGGVFKATGCRFCTGKVYRLRADYEDEPEIVECECILRQKWENPEGDMIASICQVQHACDVLIESVNALFQRKKQE